jgi:hypothetical protein
VAHELGQATNITTHPPKNKDEKVHGKNPHNYSHLILYMWHPKTLNLKHRIAKKIIFKEKVKCPYIYNHPYDDAHGLK